MPGDMIITRTVQTIIHEMLEKSAGSSPMACSAETSPEAIRPTVSARSAAAATIIFTIIFMPEPSSV
jgi:hypothetical protein